MRMAVLRAFYPSRCLWTEYEQREAGGLSEREAQKSPNWFSRSSLGRRGPSSPFNCIGVPLSLFVPTLSFSSLPTVLHPFFAFIQISTMAQERLINRNPYLYGPGPVRRVPKGFMTFYGRMPPLQGFSLAAAHGVAIAVAGAMGFKYFYGDPQIRAIEQYYEENPPR